MSNFNSLEMETRMWSLFLYFLFLGQISGVFMKDRQIEILLNHAIGVEGCRQHCEERSGCVDTRYSQPSLSCSLIFNASSRVHTKDDPICRINVCTERFLLTRLKGNVPIIELYKDSLYDSGIEEIGPLQQSRGSVGAQLSFVLLKRYTNCHIKGDKNNIIEKGQGTNCRAKSTRAFQKGRSYAWTVRTRYCREMKDLFMLLLSISSPNSKQQRGYFELKRKMRSYQYSGPSRIWEPLNGTSDTAYKFLFQKSKLHVFDVINNHSLKTVKLKGKDEETFLNVVIASNCRVRLIFNDMN